MSHARIVARINAEQAAADLTADQLVENFTTAYAGVLPATSRRITPTQPSAADLEVYAQSLRANAEKIDNTSFLGRILGL